jgi:hypothetical protein
MSRGWAWALGVKGADTLEAVAVLEQALRLMDERGDALHPGVLYMHVHTTEMSPHLERALRAVDVLGDLVPELAICYTCRCILTYCVAITTRGL